MNADDGIRDRDEWEAVEIRPYRDEDEAQVIALWREVFPDAPSWNDPCADIRRKLSVQRRLFLVAREENHVVGTVMGGYDGHRGWIYYLAVEPAQRRRGIATRLMRAVENALRSLGAPKINLQIRAGNAPVTRFYETLGYEVEDRLSFGKRLT